MKLDPSKSIAKVDAALVAAVLPFAATHDVRFYLNAVCIMPAQSGGALIVATDGHMMACAYDEVGRCEHNCIVPMVASYRSHLKRDREFYVDPDGTSYVFDAKNFGTTWINPKPLIDARYPDVRAIIGNPDDYRPGLIGTYQLALLKTIIKQGKYDALNFYHRPDENGNCENRAALFTRGRKVFGIVMPMRGDSVPATGLPAFMPAEFRIVHADLEKAA